MFIFCDGYTALFSHEMRMIKMDKTIEQIENDFWEDGDFPTGLVERIARIRKKRIGDFDDDDLRVAIQQVICLEHIMPVAIDRIKQDVLVEAFYYPGDLLMAMLGARDYWEKNSQWRDDLRDYLYSIKDLLQRAYMTHEIREDMLLKISLL